jgi:hypothetical protein
VLPELLPRPAELPPPFDPLVRVAGGGTMTPREGGKGAAGRAAGGTGGVAAVILVPPVTTLCVAAALESEFVVTPEDSFAVRISLDGATGAAAAAGAADGALLT